MKEEKSRFGFLPIIRDTKWDYFLDNDQPVSVLTNGAKYCGKVMEINYKDLCNTLHRQNHEKKEKINQLEDEIAEWKIKYKAVWEKKELVKAERDTLMQTIRQLKVEKDKLYTKSALWDEYMETL